MDFLLLLCKHFVNTNSRLYAPWPEKLLQSQYFTFYLRDVKVILMSATLECEKLVEWVNNPFETYQKVLGKAVRTSFASSYFTWRSGPLRNCGGASSHILKLNSNFDIKEFFLVSFLEFYILELSITVTTFLQDDLLCSGIKVDLNNLDKEPVITKSMVLSFSL